MTYKESWCKGLHLPPVLPEKIRHSIHPPRWLFVAVLCLCLGVGASVSLFLGQDDNWDLRNYHLYTGYSGLHDRLSIDLAAACLQSWMNPLLDIPYAWLALGPFAERPRLLAAFMGLWYGLLIAVALALAWTLYDPWPTARKWAAIAFATIVGTSGAAVISQVGTTFNEIQISTLVLTGVLLLLRSLDQKEDQRKFGAIVSLLAGVLLGLAPGLKLTAGIYFPAVCLALIVVLPPREAFVRCALVVTGWTLGFLTAGGYWSYRLLTQFGSPTFPFFNGVFRSQWYPPVNFFDRTPLPRGVWQTLFYPLYWLGDTFTTVTGPPFRDGRMGITLLLGLLAICLCALGFVARRVGFAGRLAVKPFALSGAQTFLVAFTAIAYAIWLCTTSLLRYAIPIEVGCALLLPLLLALVLRSRIYTTHSPIWASVLAGIAAALLLTTSYPQFGRTRYAERVVSADMSWVRPQSLVVLVGATMSYIVPFAPRDEGISFVGLTDVTFEARGFRLADEVLRRIREHRGPITVIWDPDDTWRLPTLQDMGLYVVQSSCRTFNASYETSKARWFHACDARIEPPRQLPSPFWLQAAHHYKEIDVPQPTPGWSYVAFVKSVGEAARGKAFADDFEYLWSRAPGRPKQFDEKLFPDTLYILDPSLKGRALRAMDKSSDMLVEVDGILALAPGWKNCRACTARPREVVSMAPANKPAS